ncbi:MAG: hypothetical protein FWC41_05220 [Firmicutes bacterium]|nr:hypothetical protein [Bacillota bacterium]
MDELKNNLGKIILGLSMVVACIDIYIILKFFAIPKLARLLVGGNVNAFALYLRYEVFGWLIFAVILSVIIYFLNGTLLEAQDKEDKYSKIGSTLTRYAGGLAVIFLVIGLLSKIIVGY